jgi:hypothetical protein
MSTRPNDMRLFILLLCSCLAFTVQAKPGLPVFNGDWRINLEETDKVAIKYKDGSGMKGSNFKPTISVMGLPLPSSRRQGPMSSLRAKDPQVLTCTDMRIAIEDERVALIYDSSGDETLKKGSYRGRTSKWSRKKIEQKYKTSERSVRKTWTMRADGRLMVSVKINPRGDKARTYNRVFDRVVNNNG